MEATLYNHQTTREFYEHAHFSSTTSFFSRAKLRYSACVQQGSFCLHPRQLAGMVAEIIELFNAIILDT